MRTLATTLIGVGLTAILAACGNDPPGLKACNYFRDEHLSLDAFWGLSMSDNLSLVRDEAEKLNELAQDAEPEIKVAAAALLQSVLRLDEPFGDAQGDMIDACDAQGYWEDRPPPGTRA